MRTTRNLFMGTSAVLAAGVIAATTVWPSAAYLWLLVGPFICSAFTI